MAEDCDQRHACTMTTNILLYCRFVHVRECVRAYGSACVRACVRVSVTKEWSEYVFLVAITVYSSIFQVGAVTYNSCQL